MVNHALKLSALASSAVHSLAILTLGPPGPYILFVLGACGTSVWNHAVTSEVAKWADRGMMAAGTVITLLIAPTVPLRLLMLLTVATYAAGKYARSTAIHMCAHWMITFINLHIMLSFL